LALVAEVVVEVAEVALTEDEVEIEEVEVVVHPWPVVEVPASTTSPLPKSTNSTRSSGTPSSRLLIGTSQAKNCWSSSLRIDKPNESFHSRDSPINPPKTSSSS
jgi:hypothetical protein